LKQLTEEENKRSRLSPVLSPGSGGNAFERQPGNYFGRKDGNGDHDLLRYRGFSSLSEGMKALDVMNLLNDHFSVMTEIIFRFEGMVDNFMGDCILAVFGGPSNTRKPRNALSWPRLKCRKRWLS